MKLQKRVPVSAMLDPKIVISRRWDRRWNSDPRLMIKNRYVRGRNRRGPDHGDLRADLLTGGANLGFTSRSSCGCVHGGCSPISPKPSRKAAKAQAESLKKTRTESQASCCRAPTNLSAVSAPAQVAISYVKPATYPSDGEVIEGVASVNEAGSQVNPHP